MSDVIAVYDSGSVGKRNHIAGIKTDEDGYAEYTLGALDCLSSREEFYVFNEAVKQVFSPNSIFMHRMRNATLRGELEHPHPKGTDDVRSFINRVKTILLSNVSHKIRKVELRRGKDENGKSIILVIGQVKPSGRYGYVMENLMKDPEENIMFSIRALSKRWRQGNQVFKQITQPVTWDLVNDGGISYATRYTDPANAVAMESAFSESATFEDLPFTEHDLAKAEEVSEKLSEVAGMESESFIDFTMIRDSFGWNKVQRISGRSPECW